MPDTSLPSSVLILTRVYPPARASSGRLARELARALARDGTKVRVLAAGDQAEEAEDGAVQVQRFQAPLAPTHVGGAVWLLLRFLMAALFSARADVVITLSDPPLLILVGDFVARIKRARHIHWAQDIYPDLLPVAGINVPGWLYRWMERATRRAMDRAACVVVTGACMRDYLMGHGVAPSRLSYIPAWPERAMFLQPGVGTRAPFLEAEEAAAASAPPVPSILDPQPKFRVLYVGTVGFAHPAETILDAATILDSMHPEIEFIFIGEPSAQPRILAEKARRGLNNIRVLPFQPQSRLRDIMESGDVHVMSMKDEAAGLMVPAKFYAALAAARPCILVGPDEGEIARILCDYGAGSVVPQGAAQALAQTIIDYRLREDVWFAAHDGAIKAAAAHTAEDALKRWIHLVQDVRAQGF